MEENQFFKPNHFKMKHLNSQYIDENVLELVRSTETKFNDSYYEGQDAFKRFITSYSFKLFISMVKSIVPIPDTKWLVRFKDEFTFSRNGSSQLLTSTSLKGSYRNALKCLLFYYGNPSGVEMDLISYRLALTYMLDGSVSFEDMRSMAYEVHKEIESKNGNVTLRNGKHINLYTFRDDAIKTFQLTDEIFIKELEECDYKPTYAEFAQSITKKHFGECFKIFKPDMVRMRAKKLGLQDRFRDPRRKRETSPFVEDKID